MQAHTLKPASVGNSDGHMVYEQVNSGDADTGGLVRFTEAGAGRCLAARTATVNSRLDAAPCSEGNTLQLWSIPVQQQKIEIMINIMSAGQSRSGPPGGL